MVTPADPRQSAAGEPAGPCQAEEGSDGGEAPHRAVGSWKDKSEHFSELVRENVCLRNRNQLLVETRHHKVMARETDYSVVKWHLFKYFPHLF
jgi:hypothetical protein